jgi:predicted transglutaminase-like cysteine proteinase
MKRPCNIRAVLAAAVISVACLTQAQGAFHSFPRNLEDAQFTQISFDQPAFQPLAHTLFCLREPDECRVRRMAFRPRAFALTQERWQDLVSVNRGVNRAIAPRAYKPAALRDTWSVEPKSGDCNDYAVTKRHRLLALGWPSRALLLAVVRTPRGEGHLVLVVRTSKGDVVLDNLRSDIAPWTRMGYDWLQIQSPRNPQYWSLIKKQTAEM